MKIWDIATGVEHKTIAAQAGKICAVAYSPRGTCVATSEYRRGSDNLIRLWDPRSGELITTIESDDFSFDLEFFPDGVRLASAQQSNVKIFNIETGEVRDFHASDTLVNDLAISRDGSRLIMSKFDRSVLVCDAQTGEILKTLQGDLVPNNKVALSPTGSQIASTGNEDSLVAWDARNETEYWLLDGHKNRIHDARFSDDFSMVFARDVMNQDLEWVLPKGIEEGLKVANANPSISSNGRYCVVPSGKNVIVADLEFKNSSYQKARREMLDVMSSSWHKSLAEHAREKGDSFAEAFHDTWMHRAKGHQKGHQELGSGR